MSDVDLICHQLQCSCTQSFNNISHSTIPQRRVLWRNQTNSTRHCWVRDCGQPAHIASNIITLIKIFINTNVLGIRNAIPSPDNICPVMARAQPLARIENASWSSDFCSRLNCENAAVKLFILSNGLKWCHLLWGCTIREQKSCTQTEFRQFGLRGMGTICRMKYGS